MRFPKYGRHSSGKARVRINGRDRLLSKYGSKENKAKYNQLVGEWIASGGSPTFGVPVAQLAVSQLLAAYLTHAKEYYGTSANSEFHRMKPALSAMRKRYGSTAVEAFGPLQFKAVFDHIGKTNDSSRRHVNRLCEKIRRMLKWAAAEAMIPPQSHKRWGWLNISRRDERNCVRRKPLNRYRTSRRRYRSCPRSMGIMALVPTRLPCIRRECPNLFRAITSVVEDELENQIRFK